MLENKSAATQTFNAENYLSQVDYQKLFKNFPAALYTCDLQGRITFYNDAAAELWGRKPEIGVDLWCGSWKIYNSDNEPIPLDTCPMAVTLKEKRAVTGQEIIVERPDRVRVNVLPHPQPIFDTEGKMIGAVNMLVDVSDLKVKSEIILEKDSQFQSLSKSLERLVEERTKELTKSEEQYHKMIDEVEDYAILLLDKNGFILNWNKGAEKIKGYSEQEIIGQNFRIFYLESDRKSMLPETLINEAANKGRAMHEGWRIRKDGTKFWGSIVITALHDNQNNIIGFSKVTRDLSERKIAEDQLREFARDIEFQNKQLAEYAYVASHDLQEPLRKIQIFSDLLEKNLNDKDKSLFHLEKIKSCSIRMHNLIRDVLRYSQLLKTDELVERVDLNSVLATISDDFELLIQEKNVTIQSSNLPQIDAIPIQMHQLFSNLISNSIKFSERDPLIKIESHPLGRDEKIANKINPNHEYIKISFEDNGIGFEQQYGNRIFQMFQRLSDYSGTGIGLALCKKIVLNHKGHINVSSEPGIGTRFEIFLPVSSHI